MKLCAGHRLGWWMLAGVVAGWLWLLLAWPAMLPGTVHAQEAAAPAWDRTLKMEVALPNQIAAASPQRLYLVLSGTEGKAISITAMIRRPSADANTATQLFRERFTSDGVFTPAFTVDENLVGDVRISIEAQKAGGGAQRLFFDVTIEPPVLTTAITTDKPLYQPGQVVHIRTISFDPLTSAAAADRDIGLEVRNPQGILVWSRGTNERFRTDQFGVAAADFQLATDIPIGIYTVATRVGPNRTEHQIMVRRYQLPKFTIKIDTDKPFYLPGGEVRAKITTTYSFGEPVKNAEVRVSLVPFNPTNAAAFDPLNESTGKSDDKGQWLYTFSLPADLARYFADQDSFPLSLRVTVKDEGGLIELTSTVRMIAKVPVRLQMFPENNTLVPGVENRIFVFTTYPDGSPAQASLTIRDQNIQVVTSDEGVGAFTFTPKAGDKGKEFFERDWETDVLTGVETARVKWNYKNQKGTPLPRLGNVQIRPTKYLVGAEQNPNFRIAANPAVKGDGELLGYLLEVQKNGHMLAIEPVELAETANANGVTRQMPADLFGQIDLVLHERRKITVDGKPAIVFVRGVANTSIYRSRGDAIEVDVRPSVATFRPREGGEIVITARRRSGERGPVLLGVDIIDTAIFGLTAVEREALQLAFMLNPRIAENRWRNSVADTSMSDNNREQFMAALFARTNAGIVGGQTADSLTFANRRTDEVLNRLREFLDRYRPYFYYDGVYRDPFAWLKQNAAETGFTDEDRRDAWNNDIQLLKEYDGKKWVLVSPGPDGKLNAEKSDAPENADNRLR